jgi:hypothetical protein
MVEEAVLWVSVHVLNFQPLEPILFMAVLGEVLPVAVLQRLVEHLYLVGTAVLVPLEQELLGQHRVEEVEAVLMAQEPVAQ